MYSMYVQLKACLIKNITVLVFLHFFTALQVNQPEYFPVLRISFTITPQEGKIDAKGSLRITCFFCDILSLHFSLISIALSMCTSTSRGTV